MNSQLEVAKFLPTGWEDGRSLPAGTLPVGENPLNDVVAMTYDEWGSISADELPCVAGIYSY